MENSKKYLIRSVLVIITWLFVWAAADPDSFQDFLGQAEERQPGLYEVLAVNDGDTITVDMNGTSERVRFIGIDTPELNHPNRGVQCFAKEASQFTKELIGDNDVRLEADSKNSNRDRFDRLLRYVYLPDGTFVNEEIIKQGYGFAYTVFNFEQIDQFQTIENQARQQNLGLWGGCEVEIEDGYISTQEIAPNQ